MIIFIPDPVIITSFTPDNSIVTVGSILTLNCTFDGNPSPSVLWSHNGSILDVQNDPNLTETITDTYGLLNIVYNGGIVVYGCIVNNTISSDETTIAIYPGMIFIMHLYYIYNNSILLIHACVLPSMFYILYLIIIISCNMTL